MPNPSAVPRHGEVCGMLAEIKDQYSKGHLCARAPALGSIQKWGPREEGGGVGHDCFSKVLCFVLFQILRPRSPLSWLMLPYCNYNLLLKPKGIIGDTVSDFFKGWGCQAKGKEGRSGVGAWSEGPSTPEVGAGHSRVGATAWGYSLSWMTVVSMRLLCALSGEWCKEHKKSK